MCVEGVPLNAGPLGHHADGRESWADAAVQLHRSFDNALPGLCLLLGAAFEGVRSCHVNLIALPCAIIIDKPFIFRYTYMYCQI
jgi:hypothetical protein